MRARTAYPRRLAAALRAFACLCLVFASCAAARASVAVLVEQPYGKLRLFDRAGHSAIYFDHICAASPTRLRACAPGEMGSVVSRYDGIAGHDWLAMPVVAYFYAVDSTQEIPRTMDKQRESELRDAYRRAHLESLAPDRADGAAPAGNWYELIGSAYDRKTYGFSVTTTPQQDAALIATFNDRRNVQRYNGFFINCADFARVTVNRFYPHAVRRNFIADFGITSPKSVARGLAHYAKKHPGVDLTTFVVPQVPGSLPRSDGTVDVAEGILKQYQYSIPLAIFSPETAAAVAVAYVGQGRFTMPKHAPLLDLNAPPAAAAPASPMPSAAVAAAATAAAADAMRRSAILLPRGGTNTE